MLESTTPYWQLPPMLIGVLLFPVGLVIGSFSSVLVHRLPRKESILKPRSHCPTCSHTLGPAELVPVLSWVWQRGRCRHCATGIPLRYPLLELLCGMAAMAGGVLAGWIGGAGLIGAWIGGALLFSRYRRKLHVQAGMTMVEVLLSVALLAAILIPMLDFSAYLRAGSAYPRELALTLAGSWMDKQLFESYAQWPLNPGTQMVPVGKYTFKVQWDASALPGTDPDRDRLQRVVVTVTCQQGCPASTTPVRMVRLFDQP